LARDAESQLRRYEGAHQGPGCQRRAGRCSQRHGVGRGPPPRFSTSTGPSFTSFFQRVSVFSPGRDQIAFHCGARSATVPLFEGLRAPPRFFPPAWAPPDSSSRGLHPRGPRRAARLEARQVLHRLRQQRGQHAGQIGNLGIVEGGQVAPDGSLARLVESSRRREGCRRCSTVPRACGIDLQRPEREVDDQRREPVQVRPVNPTRCAWGAGRRDCPISVACARSAREPTCRRSR